MLVCGSDGLEVASHRRANRIAGGLDRVWTAGAEASRGCRPLSIQSGPRRGRCRLLGRGPSGLLAGSVWVADSPPTATDGHVGCCACCGLEQRAVPSCPVTLARYADVHGES